MASKETNPISRIVIRVLEIWVDCRLKVCCALNRWQCWTRLSICSQWSTNASTNASLIAWPVLWMRRAVNRWPHWKAYQDVLRSTRVDFAILGRHMRPLFEDSLELRTDHIDQPVGRDLRLTELEVFQIDCMQVLNSETTFIKINNFVKNDTKLL